MNGMTKPRASQSPHPAEFTHLVEKVADIAMKAIIHPNPILYIQETAVNHALRLKRLRRQLVNHRRLDPTLAKAFRFDAIRNRIIRDLAISFIEAYEHFERMEYMATRISRNVQLKTFSAEDSLIHHQQDRPRPQLR